MGLKNVSLMDKIVNVDMCRYGVWWVKRGILL